MKKKILFWILSIIGVLKIVGGVHAYRIYSSVFNTLKTMHKLLDYDKSEKRQQKVDVVDEKTISILLMGCDQRTDEIGRSDSLTLFTLNSKIKPIKIVSISCNSYTEVIGKGKKDKINNIYECSIIM